MKDTVFTSKELVTPLDLNEMLLHISNDGMFTLGDRYKKPFNREEAKDLALHLYRAVYGERFCK